MSVKVRTLNVTLNANQMQVCSMFTWLHVCSTQPLCRGIQSAFRRVTHQRPRRRRRRRVYFGPYRNNPENNGMDQIVTLPLPLGD